MATLDVESTTPDEELIERSRAGETRAFAELWRRHYRPAVRAARQYTTIDADDLVSEAYARIYQRILAGGGPTGAFRPYLYTTIRNLASSWGASSHDVNVDVIEDYADDRIPVDPATDALDRTLTANAFRSLPERWQTVLWYTEVEGMDPHEVAPIMGLTANGVAALSYRAREGLRKAWLQAHVSDLGASPECRWVMSRLGERSRDALPAREKARVDAHLAGCAKCTVVADEVEEVGSHLAMVMLPLLLGGAAGGGLLAALSHPAQAFADAIPALPHQVEAVARVAAPAVAGGLALGATATTGAVVGTAAVVAAVGGGIVMSLAPAPDATPQAGGTVAQGTAPDGTTTDGLVPGIGDTGIGLPGSSGVPVDPSDIGAVIGGVGDTVSGVANGVGDGVKNATGGAGGVVGSVGDTVGNTVNDIGDTVGNTVNDIGDTVGGILGGSPSPSTSAQPTTATITVKGLGMPGAKVTLKAGGTVYASGKVASNGTYSLTATIPVDVTALTVHQDASLLGSLLNLVAATVTGVTGAAGVIVTIG